MIAFHGLDWRKKKRTVTTKSKTDDRVVVCHAVPCWLPQTQPWLYHQIRLLPASIESHILCNETLNLKQFPIPNLHAYTDVPLYMQYFDRAMRKLGIRRHYGFLVRAARGYQARILHSHFGNVGWANSKAARQLGLKHVVAFYGLDVNYLPRQDSAWRDRYLELFRQVDLVLCEGPHMARCLMELGCPASLVKIHHLGVPLDRLDFKPRTWDRTEDLRVLIAGSFREKKGIPYALEALGRLQQEVPIAITIIGDADHEPRSQSEKRRILDTMDRHGLHARTRLLGFQPYNVFRKECYRHHLFLSPSVTSEDGDTEGGAPVSLIEVLATGMPIVSTTHCDIPAIVKHGQSGLLAEERDVDGIVKHLLWLVENPEKWPEMGLQGRRHVEAEYNALTQAEHLAGIYYEMLNT